MHGSSTAGSPSVSSKSQSAWKVLHLTDRPSRIHALLNARNAPNLQARVATQNEIVSQTIQSEENPQVPSWQTAWGQVPIWREVLLEAQRQSPCEIVHSHTFPAGMAAVRNFGCVVYELENTIENLLMRSQSGDGSPSLARSFHLAEQFIFARAAAVVVYSEEMHEQLRNRGVARENLFVVNSSNSLEAEGDIVRRCGSVYRHARKTQQPTRHSKLFLPSQYSLL